MMNGVWRTVPVPLGFWLDRLAARQSVISLAAELPQYYSVVTFTTPSTRASMVMSAACRPLVSQSRRLVREFSLSYDSLIT